jgi:hypothetical protein
MSPTGAVPPVGLILHGDCMPSARVNSAKFRSAAKV